MLSCFLDNNLGGSPKYLRELCDALLPLRKTWGCSLTWNVLQDEDLVRHMARASCRYVYTGASGRSIRTRSPR